MVRDLKKLTPVERNGMMNRLAEEMRLKRVLREGGDASVVRRCLGSGEGPREILLAQSGKSYSTMRVARYAHPLHL